MQKRPFALAGFLALFFFSVAPSAQPLPAAPGGCPEVYTLKINVWENAALDLPGVRETHQRESSTRRFDKDTRVSGQQSSGAQIRAAGKDGKVKWSVLPVHVRVSLLNEESVTEHKFGVAGERVVAESLLVKGLKEVKFKRTDLEKFDAIRLVFLDGDIDSPPTFGPTGLKEIRFYNRLPGKKLGEWDNNPVPDCIMNVHAIAG